MSEAGTISGFKFRDTNGNGTRQAGEPKLVGWTIVLNGASGSIQTTVTDPAGNYSFGGLFSDLYTVTEVQQPGWTQTTLNPASIQMTSGLNSNNINFGNRQTP